jgi:hypothetical protein
MNRLEYAAHSPQVRDIALLGFSGNLLEEPDRGGLEARLGRLIHWIDDLHLDLDSEVASLHPALSLLTSFCHGSSVSIVYGHELRSAALGKPGPDGFDFSSSCKDLSHPHRRIGLCMRTLLHEFGVLDLRHDLPDGGAPFFATFVRMPRHKPSIFSDCGADLVKELPH